VSNAAQADLPEHPAIAGFSPAQAEIFPIDGEPPVGLTFGAAVAIRNGKAFIGMTHFDPTGGVAVFVQSTDGGWERTQRLVPSDPTPTQFGRALAFRDGVLIVRSNAGAYIFRRLDGLWREAQKLPLPSDLGESDSQHPLKYEAGVLAIGSRTPELHGMVQLYKVNVDTGKFMPLQRLTAADGKQLDGFGSSLGVTRSAIVVGAADAAYVFRRNADGRWVQRQKLLPAQGAGGFGYAVAIDNDMILVGAPFTDGEGGNFGETPDGHAAQGAVYGFVPVNGHYVETFKLRPRPDELFQYERFGHDLAMFGGHIAVATSAPAEFRPVQAYAVTYARTGTVVLPEGIAANFQHAPLALAIANNLLLVGSRTVRCDPFGDPCIGQALLYDLNRHVQ